MTPALSILIAEDDEMDVILLRRAFKDADLTNPVHVVGDGQQAIDYLMELRTAASDRLPALALLDLKMPRRDGFDVLQWIRHQPILCGIPAIVFSSSANRHDIERAYDLGANAYLVKPPSIAARADAARFLKDWLRLVQPPLAASEGYKAARAERPVEGNGE